MIRIASMARWVLAVVVAAGCGPVGYIGQVTSRASNAVDAAREAQADKYAPYYWTRATEYLRMAREQAARADFQGAIHFGELAQDAGDRAAAEAELAKKDPSRMPLDVSAPAKASGAKIAPAKDTP